MHDMLFVGGAFDGDMVGVAAAATAPFGLDAADLMHGPELDTFLGAVPRAHGVLTEKSKSRKEKRRDKHADSPFDDGLGMPNLAAENLDGFSMGTEKQRRVYSDKVLEGKDCGALGFHGLRERYGGKWHCVF